MELMIHAAENPEKPDAADPNGLICYVFGVLFPVLYLLSIRRIRQYSFLRFHCFQCLILFVLWSPFLLMSLAEVWAQYVSMIGSLLGLLAWLVAMVQAGRRRYFHLPLIGIMAERLAQT